eukprot:1179622-Prorocentrum_minimum.AAC.2
MDATHLPLRICLDCAQSPTCTPVRMDTHKHATRAQAVTRARLVERGSGGGQEGVRRGSGGGNLVT